MSSLLSIDPGLKSVGWAYWEGRELQDCGLSRTKALSVSTQAEDHLKHVGHYVALGRAVGEMMVWRGAKARSSPADLLKINIISGHLCTEWVTPSQWKGHVPKAVHQPRILAKLHPEELDVLNGCKCPSSLLHNVIDAIGIGLFTLGRLRVSR